SSGQGSSRVRMEKRAPSSRSSASTKKSGRMKRSPTMATAMRFILGSTSSWLPPIVVPAKAGTHGSEVSVRDHEPVASPPCLHHHHPTGGTMDPGFRRDDEGG